MHSRAIDPKFFVDISTSMSLLLVPISLRTWEGICKAGCLMYIKEDHVAEQFLLCHFVPKNSVTMHDFLCDSHEKNLMCISELRDY